MTSLTNLCSNKKGTNNRRQINDSGALLSSSVSLSNDQSMLSEVIPPIGTQV